MNPTTDQYDSTVDKIQTIDKLAETGLDVGALFAIGLAVALLGVVLWLAMRRVS